MYTHLHFFYYCDDEAAHPFVGGVLVGNYFHDDGFHLDDGVVAMVGGDNNLPCCG